MSVKLQPDDALTAPEVARRLDVRPREVYRLVFARELAGGPDRHGQIRVHESEVARYLARRSQSV